MTTMLRRCLGAAAARASSVVAQGCKPPNYPTGTIELQFYANGTWPVTVQTGTLCCDSSGNKFDLYYPTNLGANGFKHPILTWGNGTFGKPSDVDYFLKHMASWGFRHHRHGRHEYGRGPDELGRRKIHDR